MTDATPLPFDLPSVERKKLTVDFAGGNQSSNGGLLLLRQAERKLGVCGRLADAMPDRRDASRIRHDMFEMVMARVAAIACGHEDAIDLDRLRHDPLMKVAVGRCPITGAPLASQSTISRLENAPSKTEAARLTAALVDQAGTTVKPGRQEILDIDDTFCAAHGGQQLAFWNAHHDERGFASMHIYHVASGTPVVAILRPARTPKGTEVRTVIKHVTKRLRRHWRKTRIIWRGDSHYGRYYANNTLGRARVPEVVDFIGHLRESLAGLERLRRLAIQLQDNGTFQDVNKSWRWMKVSTGCRARRDVSDPNMHLVVLDLSQVRFKKVRSLDRLLLSICWLTADHA